MLTSRDTVTAITGGAGTGKTSLMQEAADALRGNGKEVFVFASSTGAREALQEKGFAGAQTVEYLIGRKGIRTSLFSCCENTMLPFTDPRPYDDAETRRHRTAAMRGRDDPAMSASSGQNLR